MLQIDQIALNFLNQSSSFGLEKWSELLAFDLEKWSDLPVFDLEKWDSIFNHLIIIKIRISPQIIIFDLEKRNKNTIFAPDFFNETMIFGLEK